MSGTMMEPMAPQDARSNDKRSTTPPPPSRKKNNFRDLLGKWASRDVPDTASKRRSSSISKGSRRHATRDNAHHNSLSALDFLYDEDDGGKEGLDDPNVHKERSKTVAKDAGMSFNGEGALSPKSVKESLRPRSRRRHSTTAGSVSSRKSAPSSPTSKNADFTSASMVDILVSPRAARMSDKSAAVHPMKWRKTSLQATTNAIHVLHKSSSHKEDDAQARDRSKHPRRNRSLQSTTSLPHETAVDRLNMYASPTMIKRKMRIKEQRKKERTKTSDDAAAAAAATQDASSEDAKRKVSASAILHSLAAEEEYLHPDQHPGSTSETTSSSHRFVGFIISHSPPDAKHKQHAAKKRTSVTSKNDGSANSPPSQQPTRSPKPAASSSPGGDADRKNREKDANSDGSKYGDLPPPPKVYRSDLQGADAESADAVAAKSEDVAIPAGTSGAHSTTDDGAAAANKDSTAAAHAAADSTKKKRTDKAQASTKTDKSSKRRSSTPKGAATPNPKRDIILPALDDSPLPRTKKSSDQIVDRTPSPERTRRKKSKKSQRRSRSAGANKKASRRNSSGGRSPKRKPTVRSGTPPLTRTPPRNEGGAHDVPTASPKERLPIASSSARSNVNTAPLASQESDTAKMSATIKPSFHGDDAPPQSVQEKAEDVSYKRPQADVPKTRSPRRNILNQCSIFERQIKANEDSAASRKIRSPAKAGTNYGKAGDERKNKPDDETSDELKFPKRRFTTGRRSRQLDHFTPTKTKKSSVRARGNGGQHGDGNDVGGNLMDLMQLNPPPLSSSSNSALATATEPHPSTRQGQKQRETGVDGVQDSQLHDDAHTNQPAQTKTMTAQKTKKRRSRARPKKDPDAPIAKSCSIKHSWQQLQDQRPRNQSQPDPPSSTAADTGNADDEDGIGDNAGNHVEQDGVDTGAAIDMDAGNSNSNSNSSSSDSSSSNTQNGSSSIPDETIENKDDQDVKESDAKDDVEVMPMSSKTTRIDRDRLVLNEINKMILDVEEKELEDIMDDEVADCFREAAVKSSAYTLRWYDAFTDSFLHCPSLAATILDFTLIEKAEEIYGEELPLLYTVSLRSVASYAAQDEMPIPEYIYRLAEKSTESEEAAAH